MKVIVKSLRKVNSLDLVARLLLQAEYWSHVISSLKLRSGTHRDPWALILNFLIFPTTFCTPPEIPRDIYRLAIILFKKHARASHFPPFLQYGGKITMNKLNRCPEKEKSKSHFDAVQNFLPINFLDRSFEGIFNQLLNLLIVTVL